MTPLWKSRLPQKIGAQLPHGISCQGIHQSTIGVGLKLATWHMDRMTHCLNLPSRILVRNHQNIIRIKLSTAISTIELHFFDVLSIQPLTLIQRISILFWQYAKYNTFRKSVPHSMQRNPSRIGSHCALVKGLQKPHGSAPAATHHRAQCHYIWAWARDEWI